MHCFVFIHSYITGDLSNLSIVVFNDTNQPNIKCSFLIKSSLIFSLCVIGTLFSYFLASTNKSNSSNLI